MKSRFDNCTKFFLYDSFLYRQTFIKGNVHNEIYYPELGIFSTVEDYPSNDFDIPYDAVVLSSKKFRREVDKLRIQIKIKIRVLTLFIISCKIIIRLLFSCYFFCFVLGDLKKVSFLLA